MKLFAITFLTLILASGLAMAQSGGIVGIYTDAGGFSDCVLYESLGSVNSVWVVHSAGPDVERARFRVTHNWDLAVDLGAWYPVIYLVEPDVYGGDLLSLPGCEPAPSAFVRLDFLSLTPTPPCTVELAVEPDPDAASGQIEVVDCGGNVLTALAGPPVIVNGNQDCPCGEPPVDTEKQTWSRLKALYR